MPLLDYCTKNLNKTVARVTLRFLTQNGIIVMPKSTHIERMKEIIASLKFDMNADEMREIERRKKEKDYESFSD